MRWLGALLVESPALNTRKIRAASRDAAPGRRGIISCPPGAAGHHHRDLIRPMAFFRKLSLKGFGEKKKDMPEGQWHKCPACKAMLHELELAENLRVCPKCAHHYPLDSEARVASLIDEGSWDPMDLHLRSMNPLVFKGYSEKVDGNMKKTGLNEA